MFIEKYFEDFSLSECRVTTGRTITESDIVIHAGQTGDFYPHHMDAEWCKTQPFGQRIAHGTLTFAIAVGMTAGIINSKAMTYGYEKLRFPHPVFIGDTLHVNISIAEKREHPRNDKYGFVTEKLEVINQRNECVLATQHVLLVEKRDAVD